MDTTKVSNLGTKGRRQRLLVGLGMLLVTAAGLVLVTMYEPPRWTRLAFALPLFLAGLGLFQAQAST